MLLESNVPTVPLDDQPDVLVRECPTRLTLEVISSTWTVLVIHVLAEGTHRYGELKNRIGGITHKMLAQTLRALERDGLLARHIYPVVPPRVDYTLTPRGQTLVPLLEGLCRWSEEHYGGIEASRREYQAMQKDQSRVLT